MKSFISKFIFFLIYDIYIYMFSRSLLDIIDLDRKLDIGSNPSSTIK